MFKIENAEERTLGMRSFIRENERVVATNFC